MKTYQNMELPPEEESTPDVVQVNGLALLNVHLLFMIFLFWLYYLSFLLTFGGARTS